MKSNYMCANLECEYETNREDNLKLKDLAQVVKQDGGYVKGDESHCPKCKKYNTLVYVSDSETEKVTQ